MASFAPTYRSSVLTFLEKSGVCIHICEQRNSSGTKQFTKSFPITMLCFHPCLYQTECFPITMLGVAVPNSSRLWHICAHYFLRFHLTQGGTARIEKKSNLRGRKSNHRGACAWSPISLQQLIQYVTVSTMTSGKDYRYYPNKRVRSCVDS